MDIFTFFLSVLPALSLLGYAIVSDPVAVHLESVTVTEELNRAGITSQYVADEFLEAIDQANRMACSRLRPTPFNSHYDETPVRAFAQFFHADGLIRTSQRALGLFQSSLDGYFQRRGPQLVFVVKGKGPHTGRFTVEAEGDEGDVRTAVRAAALEVTRRINPYAHLLYEYRQALDSGDFTTIRTALAAAPARSEPEELVWIYNLSGLTEFAAGRVDVATAEFRRAIHAAPQACIPHLNLGMLLARGSHPQDAMTAFDACLPRLADMAPITKGVFLAERAMAHAALGAPAAAIEDLTAAAVAYPEGSWIYESWSDVLDTLGQHDRAETMRTKATSLIGKDNVYSEILLEAIRIRQGRPDATDCSVLPD
jgi:tetratricopeptide (TPR) repeat protein